jgi:pSer/pThr/pTyr-binding forkhead associated (FHA) protein
VRDASEDTLTLAVIDGTAIAEGVPGSVGDSLPVGVDLLLVNSGPSSGARFAVESPTLRAGRSEDSDIFLDDVTVSREHVQFSQTDSGRLVVRDLGSLNGTYVNNVRVDEKVLDSGDEVQIGKFKLIYIAARDR